MKNLHEYIDYKRMWEDLVDDYVDNLDKIEDTDKLNFQPLRDFISAQWKDIVPYECSVSQNSEGTELFFYFEDFPCSASIWYDLTHDKFVDFEIHLKEK
jgi:hypothetical protein